MNELAEQSQQFTDGITEVGLVGADDLDEADFFEAGRVIVKAEHGLQWAIGDWYNLIKWGDKEKACERIGLKDSTAKTYGAVASTFIMATRMANLPFGHHVVAAHEDIRKGKRTELLKLAIEGTPNKNGVNVRWSAKRLKEERDKILGIMPPEPVDGFVEKVDALTEAVVSVLPKTAGRVAVNKTRKGVQKLAADMQHEFNKAVDKKVDESLKVQRDNLKTAKTKAKDEFERTINMQAGVKAFMNREEFILVRSCLHPDKNSHPKANEAFTIFNRLADVKAWDK